VCKQLIMIGPCDVSYFNSNQKKLKQLREEFSKQNALKFVSENAKYYQVNNLKIL